MIFTEQIRAARALLGWTQEELAIKASIGVATLRRLEGAKGEIRGTADTIWKIQKALAQGGVEFIDGDDTRGPGVRLKTPLAQQ